MKDRTPAHPLARFGLALLLIGALLGLTAPARPAHAQSAITVNSAQDPGKGGCDAAECTLREAIAAAGTGATISFSPSISAITLSAGELVIARGMTIQGPGFERLSINAGGRSRAFRVEATTSPVVIAGLTITSGDAGAGAGGGILNNGASLRLEAVAVTSNRAASGGGVANNLGVLHIQGGFIALNEASGGGGGIFSNGAGERLAVTLDGATVTLNRAEQGGGIDLRSSRYDTECAQISRAIISRNQATSNTATPISGGGGGIATRFCSLAISASAIFENQAQDQGGGINAVVSSLTISHSTLRANISQELGGAVSFVTDAATPLQLLASTITENSAANGGGVLMVYNTPEDRFGGNIIAGNRARLANPDVSFMNFSGQPSRGYNLIGVDDSRFFAEPTDSAGTTAAPLDPQLAPLAADPGSTPTVFLPRPGSPALNAIPPEACVGTSDQRGLARPQGGRCEIGAAEVEAPANSPPTVSIGGPYSVDEGSDLLISAVAADPDGDSLSYSWTRDGQFVGREARLLLPGPTLFGPARIELSLTVRDPAGLTAEATTEVIVNNVAPAARIVAPAEVTAGQPFTIELADIRDPGHDLLFFAFDCGDGEGFSRPAIGVTSWSCPTSVPGVREVRASVQDESGGRNEYAARVTVAPPPVTQTATSLAP